MCVALVGGMARMERRYVDEASRLGVELRVFNQGPARFGARLGGVDAVVVFTDRVSHGARREAARVARSRNIPLVQRHSCGLCALRDCLRCLAGPGTPPEGGEAGAA